MDRAQLDALITTIVATQDRVSDLLFITGKAALVEVDGRLSPLEIEGQNPVSTEFIDAMSALIIGEDQRLLSDYETTGSCDGSYVVEGGARFRVNIYKEKNQCPLVMRKLRP